MVARSEHREGKFFPLKAPPLFTQWDHKRLGDEPEIELGTVEEI